MPWFTALFLAALASGTLLRLWLEQRQLRSVVQGRQAVPAAFADRISPADHTKAAEYTIARVRLGRLAMLLDAAVVLALTTGGGIEAVDGLWLRSGWEQPWRGTAVIISVVALIAVVDLPLALWRTFRLEARFGFNRTTLWLFALDRLKSAVLAAVIGTPVVLAGLMLMDRAGRLWWLWAWIGWVVLMLVMSWAWPAFFARFFNRFSPLTDQALRLRIEALLERCGFASKGVFVVDGSRRSAHGNAYFTGIGRQKRIVFFDTLLSQLTHAEVEAVLAHELGHFRLNHVRKRLAAAIGMSLAALALLGWLVQQPWFFTQLGVSRMSSHAALLLFTTVAPVFMFFATPLSALWSRRHEFAADAFAAHHADARELSAALVKLYRDNASTLTPDPVYSAFYYSHPPATERIARLRAMTASGLPLPAAG